MTAATMFMDVDDRLRRQVHPDPGGRRRARTGPAPLGPPVLAQHPLDQGRDHERPRPLLHRAKDFGIHWVPKSVPVVSMSDRHDRGPPDRHDRRLRRDRRRRQAHAADDDPQGDPGRRDGRLADGGRRRSRRPKTVISPQAAYIITDILAGNTELEDEPVLGRVGDLRQGVRRPAAYKTGTTNDNKRRPRVRVPGAAEGSQGAGPRRRGLDGQQQQRPRTATRCRSGRRRRSGRGS